MSDFLDRLRIANAKRNEEWGNSANPFSLMFFANELAGEVGEACNVLKKFDREFTYKVKGSRDNMDHLGEELADVIICSDLLGMRGDLDYPPECWTSRPMVREAHDYSLYGSSLASLAGRICGIVIHYETHVNKLQLQTAARGMITFTKSTADRLGVDLEDRVKTKFNLTSYKLGFKTVL